MLIPHVPGIMTDYFASRRAGHPLHCEGMDRGAPDAAACRVRRACLLLFCCLSLFSLAHASHARRRGGVGPHRTWFHAADTTLNPTVYAYCVQDAHADVVMWSSWTSFFSNSFVSIVLVSSLWVGSWNRDRLRLQFWQCLVVCGPGPGMVQWVCWRLHAASQSPHPCCRLVQRTVPAVRCRRRCWATGATCTAASLSSSSRRCLAGAVLLCCCIMHCAVLLHCAVLQCCCIVLCAVLCRCCVAHRPPAWRLWGGRVQVCEYGHLFLASGGQGNLISVLSCAYVPPSLHLTPGSHPPSHQASACIPLTIVLLHLTRGLPLLWYYVVQVRGGASRALCTAALAPACCKHQQQPPPTRWCSRALASSAFFLGRCF